MAGIFTVSLIPEVEHGGFRVGDFARVEAFGPPPQSSGPDEAPQPVPVKLVGSVTGPHGTKIVRRTVGVLENQILVTEPGKGLELDLEGWWSVAWWLGNQQPLIAPNGWYVSGPAAK